MSSPVRIALTAILGTALVGEAAVLYAITSPDTRFLMGMGILAVVIGITAILARAAISPADEVAPATRFHTRRFIRLRSYVEQFLAQVRRLHRLAVDLEHGIRDRVSTEEEMDTIEERLILLVREIRAAAGVEEGGRHESSGNVAGSAGGPERAS